MHRALIALSLTLVVAAGLLLWAVHPVTDALERSCGGGVFSTTSADPSDDSFKDVCDGIRETREQLIEPLAVAVGLALMVSLGCVLVLADERRHAFT